MVSIRAPSITWLGTPLANGIKLVYQEPTQRTYARAVTSNWWSKIEGESSLTLTSKVVGKQEVAFAEPAIEQKTHVIVFLSSAYLIFVSLIFFPFFRIPQLNWCIGKD
jgi:hypothetical protein